MTQRKHIQDVPRRYKIYQNWSKIKTSSHVKCRGRVHGAVRSSKGHNLHMKILVRGHGRTGRYNNNRSAGLMTEAVEDYKIKIGHLPTENTPADVLTLNDKT